MKKDKVKELVEVIKLNTNFKNEVDHLLNVYLSPDIKQKVYSSVEQNPSKLNSIISNANKLSKDQLEFVLDNKLF